MGPPNTPYFGGYFFFDIKFPTNYPEKLDKRVKSRPRRFDRVVKINNPNKEMRKKFFEIKLILGLLVG